MAIDSNNSPRHDLEAITRPDPKKYTQEILCWILFWPWNLVWSVCVNNPFRYMGQFLVNVIRSTFDEISSGEFKKIEAELSLAAPIESQTTGHEASRSTEPSGASDMPKNGMQAIDPQETSPALDGTSKNNIASKDDNRATLPSDLRPKEPTNELRNTELTNNDTPIWNPRSHDRWSDQSLDSAANPSGENEQQAARKTPPPIPSSSTDDTILSESGGQIPSHGSWVPQPARNDLESTADPLLYLKDADQAPQTLVSESVDSDPWYLQARRQA